MKRQLCLICQRISIEELKHIRVFMTERICFHYYQPFLETHSNFIESSAAQHTLNETFIRVAKKFGVLSTLSLFIAMLPDYLQYIRQ